MVNFSVHLPGYYPSFSISYIPSTIETSFLQVTIYPIFYKQNIIEWSIPAHWGACTFNVYRSETEYASYIKLNSTPTSSNHFKDISAQDFSKFQNAYYIVECILPAGQKIKSPSRTWENKRSNWVEIRASEIRRRETLLLTKFTGIKSLVFARKNFGERCQECWDYDTEQVTKDHCPSCLGTSFQGGYFPGIETLLHYDPTPNTGSLEYQGLVERNQIQAWTIDYPRIDIFDLVLRIPDYKIYRVDQISTSELQAVVVRQTLVLNELAKESIEFKLANQVIPQGYLS